MKRLCAFALVVAIATLGVPPQAFAAPAGNQETGTISGTAQDTSGKPLVGVYVRLRNSTTGALAGLTATDSTGAFSFTLLAPGTYVAELVGSTGAAIAVSPLVTIAPANLTTSGILLVPSATNAAGLLLASGGGLGAFFTSTTGIVLLAAAGVGIGVGIYEATKSRSR